MDNFKFMKESVKEEDVAHHYRNILEKLFKNCKIVKEYNTDGVLYSDNLKCLLEFKYDLDMKDRNNIINILIQCLYYLKDFKDRGDIIPNVIFIGDKNEFFSISSEILLKYLDEDIDWSISASTAYSNKSNKELFQKLYDDVEIKPFISDLERCKSKEIYELIIVSSKNNQIEVNIDPNNLSREFDYFTNHILKNKKIPPNKLSNLFIQMIIDPDEYFIHPKKKTILCGPNIEDSLKVDPQLFNAFINRIKKSSYENCGKLVSMCDRLIEDCTRRKQGEFYTPTIWVDEAHRMITEQLGENWKDEYIVWDPACGTCNLTRDYKFKELYLSTLHQEDLDTANKLNINPEATKFQFDFLNDSMELHNPYKWEKDEKFLPAGLIKVFKENKKIVIFMNPPFGNAYSGLGKGDKKGYNDTKLKQFLLDNNIKVGKATKELSVQFLLRILLFKKTYKLNDLNLFLFSPPSFMVGEYFINFRKLFLHSFKFEKGLIFNSGEFTDINCGWGILFSYWNKNIQQTLNNNFNINIFARTTDNIKSSGNIILYNTDGETSSKYWIFEDINKKQNKIYVPTMVKMGLLDDKNYPLYVLKNFIGIYDKSTNSIGRDISLASLFSMPYNRGNGDISITYDNISKILSIFTAKMVVAADIKNQWLTKELQVLKPNTSHPLFPQFTRDSIIYSIFNNRCRTYSMRQYPYKDKMWDVKNEFFWVPRKLMMDLANEYGNYKLYKDAEMSKDRYISKLLWNKIEGKTIYSLLSSDAQEILRLATELLIKSFPLRKDYEEQHLDCFDCGYEQLKRIWKEHFPEEFRIFKEKYKAFGERLRPLVYELGFLKGEPL